MQQNDADIVFIQGLQVDAIIGVYAWEQSITQPLIYDIKMVGCQKQAAATDDIHDAINYKTVCERIAEVSMNSRVSLLERLAQLVADMILAEFQPDMVSVTIHKPTAIANAQSVGVKIVRHREI